MDFIGKGKLRLHGHFMRMDEQTLPRIGLCWTTVTKRPVERPRMQWMKGIKGTVPPRIDHNLQNFQKCVFN